MQEPFQIPKFLAVDFYCGAGGTTRGLLDAGGYVIAGIDRDADCRETYTRNNPNTRLDGAAPAFLNFDLFPATPEHPEGQQELVYAELRKLIPPRRAMAPEVPLLFAICAPCQSFTKFVQRNMTASRSESRNRDMGLLHETIGFIAEFQPDMIISENVSTIGRGANRAIWDDFRAQLIRLGYNARAGRVCASRFGVPQYRRRAILMAVKKAAAEALEFDIPIPERDPAVRAATTVREALDGLPPLQAGESCPEVPNHVCRNLSLINRNRLRSVKPGEPNYGFAESPFGDLSLPCHRRLEGSKTRGFGDVYTRIHPDRPAPTITTRFLTISCGRFGHYDEEQVRGLSLREGALLQSFKRDYEFFGDGLETVSRMIGNAVPPKLSAYMAKHLVGQWQEAGGVVNRDPTPAPRLASPNNIWYN